LLVSKVFQRSIIDLNLNLPPSAPERTLQASGQGQAVARLNGGLPCCSVPAYTTRRAAKRRHAAAEETKKEREKKKEKESTHKHYTNEILLGIIIMSS
jgi:hypothetical protein